jgi:hypothetical protein
VKNFIMFLVMIVVLMLVVRVGVAVWPFNGKTILIALFSIIRRIIYIDDPTKDAWQFTGYHGFLEVGRRDAWNFLRNLARDVTLPWCIGGDYNDILFEHEKVGENERAMLDYGLTNAFMFRYQYTWFKSLGTPQYYKWEF